MKIKDIKIASHRPVLLGTIMVRGQSVGNVHVGRIQEGQIRNADIKVLWLTEDLAIIRNIWITPNVGLYVSFSEPIEAEVCEKSAHGEVSVTSHDADGEIKSEFIGVFLG